jgi:hypothetical protein
MLSTSRGTNRHEPNLTVEYGLCSGRHRAKHELIKEGNRKGKLTVGLAAIRLEKTNWIPAFAGMTGMTGMTGMGGGFTQNDGGYQSTG